MIDLYGEVFFMKWINKKGSYESEDGRFSLSYTRQKEWLLWDRFTDKLNKVDSYKHGEKVTEDLQDESLYNVDKVNTIEEISTVYTHLIEYTENILLGDFDEYEKEGMRKFLDIFCKRQSELTQNSDFGIERKKLLGHLSVFYEDNYRYILLHGRD